jgi:hypothetical protein
VSEPLYHPRLRTALVLIGTGTAGAYHAGALQALHEAGIKIDLVAGRGMGAVGALFAAVDGGEHLWGPRGFWRGAAKLRFYRFRLTLRLTAWLFGAALAALLAPLALLAALLLVYLAGRLTAAAGASAIGDALTAWYHRSLDLLFAAGAIPTLVPRLVALALMAALAVAALRLLVKPGGPMRRTRGSVWWRIAGAPLSARPIVGRLTKALWQLIRGAAHVAQPTAPEVGRRYVELLTENLGQPGFRELLLTIHDLDARRDLVFGVLSEPHRTRFFTAPRGPGGPRGAEAFDLAGVGREYVLDVLAASLTLPAASEAHLLTFPAEGYWRGETHRVTDRPDALVRLFLEAAAAGAEQLIVVSDAPGPGEPHSLSSGRADLRGRLGEHLRASETAAARDALAAAGQLFRGVFEIRPRHNPVGPFDWDGTYDEQSDRRHGVAELVNRGYEDAYRQFVDPVVGASGERLAQGGRAHDAARRGPA